MINGSHYRINNTLLWDTMHMVTKLTLILYIYLFLLKYTSVSTLHGGLIQLFSNIYGPQNPHFVVLRSIYWSRATITLDGIQTSYADSKHSYSFQKRNQLTGEETLNEEDDLARTGTIASVLIATVAFAAAFTAPGGFVADDHPPRCTEYCFAKLLKHAPIICSSVVSCVD